MRICFNKGESVTVVVNHLGGPIIPAVTIINYDNKSLFAREFDYARQDMGGAEQQSGEATEQHHEQEVCPWCLDAADVEIKVERGDRYCSKCGSKLLAQSEPLH